MPETDSSMLDMKVRLLENIEIMFAAKSDVSFVGNRALGGSIRSLQFVWTICEVSNTRSFRIAGGYAKKPPSSLPHPRRDVIRWRYSPIW